MLFDKPVSSLGDCSCCRWKTFPGDTTSPQPSAVKGEQATVEILTVFFIFKEVIFFLIWFFFYNI